jgi:hypothetical protein
MKRYKVIRVIRIFGVKVYEETECEFQNSPTNIYITGKQRDELIKSLEKAIQDVPATAKGA